jgi:hypothetical protein
MCQISDLVYFYWVSYRETGTRLFSQERERKKGGAEHNSMPVDGRTVVDYYDFPL